MKQRIQQWKERFDALSLRERVLVMLGIIAVLHSIWNFALMRVLHKQQQALLTQVHQKQKSVSDIDNKIQMITASIAPTSKSAAMQRIKTLKSEIQRINEVKKNVTVGFIRPKQMTEVLEGLLNKEPGLKLVSFRSLDVEPLFARSASATGNKNAKQIANQNINQNKVNTSNSVQGKAQQSPAAYPEVYKHGVVIAFEGDYRSTVHYLQSLEALPWKFYWDGLAYEVEDYPKAMITINVFTLSLEKGWIGV